MQFSLYYLQSADWLAQDTMFFSNPALAHVELAIALPQAICVVDEIRFPDLQEVREVTAARNPVNGLVELGGVFREVSTKSARKRWSRGHAASTLCACCPTAQRKLLELWRT